METWYRGLDGHDQKKRAGAVFENLGAKLHELYVRKLQPAEGYYNFREFHSAPLDMAYFQAKPMVLLLGEYSVGKTSFIKYLLERSFPAMQIGPEPTTDKFHIVTHGEFDKMLPGHALVVDPTKPFRELDRFGGNFLNRLQCSTVRSSVLKSLTLVDTPGILANVERGYDFAAVLKWFADRSDLIIMLCDPLKLDISDELRRCLDTIAHCDDKIRIVFNKADQINYQELMRTYGALMWNLGKVLSHPETPRVYVGTFWDKSFFHDENRHLFEDEKSDLYNDLASLPKQALINKVDAFLERVKSVFIHALIIGRLKEQIKSVIIGKSFKRQEILNNLKKTFEYLQDKYKVTEYDFPDIESFQKTLEHQDLSKFHTTKNSVLEPVLNLWKEDIPAIMKELSDDGFYAEKNKEIIGVFESLNELDLTPFGTKKDKALDVAIFQQEWPPTEMKKKKANEFQRLGPIHGKLPGAKAKPSLLKTKLPRSVLGKIWTLSDVDSDGMLDEDEFALAFYLADQSIQGSSLPSSLPSHLYPPKYKDLYSPDVSLETTHFLDASTSSNNNNSSPASVFAFETSPKQKAPWTPFDRSVSIDSGIFPDPNGDAVQTTSATDSGMSTPEHLAEAHDSPKDTEGLHDVDASGAQEDSPDLLGAIGGTADLNDNHIMSTLSTDSTDSKSLHSSSSRALDSIAEEEDEDGGT